MYSNGIGWNVTDNTSADVRSYFVPCDRHHGYRGGGRQPIGFVVSAGVIADVVEITEDERHRVETLEARTRPSLKEYHLGLVSYASKSGELVTSKSGELVTSKVW